MKNYNPVRGTYDYMPDEAKFREAVKEKILASYQSNGFNLISTPILESLEYLNSSDGGDNLRLMFKTLKRGDKLDLTKPNLTETDIAEEGLRYDLTVPLARFYANNRDRLVTPFKSIQIDYAFRAERPQRGRNRQFVQCDIDIMGDSTINSELDLLKTTMETYSMLGFENLTLKISDRRILNALVLSAGFEKVDINSVCVTLDKIDKIGLEGMKTELSDKGFDIKKINTLAQIMSDVLVTEFANLTRYGVDEKVSNNLRLLIENLKMLAPKNYKIKFDITIVRGQGYYTGTVYEFYVDGFNGAIGGGGRYDNMIEKITGLPCSAVGASIGFEPVTMLLLEKGNQLNLKKNLALIYDEADELKQVFAVKQQLMGIYNVSIFAKPKNMKSFYEKISSVADCVTTVRDVVSKKEIKSLEK